MSRTCTARRAFVRVRDEHATSPYKLKSTPRWRALFNCEKIYVRVLVRNIISASTALNMRFILIGCDVDIDVDININTTLTKKYLLVRKARRVPKPPQTNKEHNTDAQAFS